MKRIKIENFNTIRDKLESHDIDQLVELLGKRCSVVTHRRLRIHLEMNTSVIPFYGILDRLMRENGKWSYCAGQSYPDEIRTVREIILNLK